MEAYILALPENTSHQDHPPLYFRQHGFCKLSDGRYVFVCGDEVLGLPPEQMFAIAPQVARAHLAYDKNLPLDQARGS